MEIDTGSMPLLNEKRVRENDLDRPLKITREVPLWTLLSVVATLVCGAFGLYYQLKSVAEIQVDQTPSLRELKGKVDDIRMDIAKRDADSRNLDYRIGQNERRISTLEINKGK